MWKADPNIFLVAGDRRASPSAGPSISRAGRAATPSGWPSRAGPSTGVDFSDVGLDKGRRLAAERGVDVDWVCADATTWEPPEDGYDLVAVFYLQLPADQRRQAMAVAGRALAPGGTLLVVAHDSTNLTDGTGGPPDPAVLYTPADVLADLEAAGIDVTVERAETVERTVAGAERPALDCLVRARR